MPRPMPSHMMAQLRNSALMLILMMVVMMRAQIAGNRVLSSRRSRHDKNSLRQSFSDSYGPLIRPPGGWGGVIAQNHCHCIAWEKATTIKMRLSKMLFFLCFGPTIKFQGGSPVDLTLFSNPLRTPLLTRPFKIYFYRHYMTFRRF